MIQEAPSVKLNLPLKHIYFLLLFKSLFSVKYISMVLL
jgi:hypothetical protein